MSGLRFPRPAKAVFPICPGFSLWIGAWQLNYRGAGNRGEMPFVPPKKIEQKAIENAIINSGTGRSVITVCGSAGASVGGAFPEGFPLRFNGLFMHNLVHWLVDNGGVLAILVTAGVAVLLVCCLECSNCSCREKDDIFKHHEV
jgi:hypothetical protein